MINYIFSRRLQQLRKHYHLSQKSLAVTLKVTPATISNYENGIYLPPIESACLLAGELHCSLDYLAGRTEYNIDPVLFSKPATKVCTFYQLLAFLFTLDPDQLQETINYGTYLKDRQAGKDYLQQPSLGAVAEESLE